jgi:hypothetical protein
MNTDYIPRPDAAFATWAQNLYDTIAAHYGAWQIPAPADIEAPLLAFDAAWQKYLNPNHGKIDTLEKDQTRKALVEAIRAYYNTSLRFNKLVTGADRETMGLPIYDNTRTPAAAPTTIPVADKIDLNTLRQITIHFRDHGSANKAKPKGVHGCEIRWALRNAPPAQIDDLTASSFDTNSPFTLGFDESQRGQTLYFCLRWEGVTGLKGPYGEIYSAIVP